MVMSGCLDSVFRPSNAMARLDAPDTFCYQGEFSHHRLGGAFVPPTEISPSVCEAFSIAALPAV